MTSKPPERARVLCVDDEPNILASLRRTLRFHYEVVTADNAETALALLERGLPFAVVISDLRMPGTDGVALLRKVKERAPDTVRVLLTGDADLNGAIAAVNEGQLFRFLVKPCAPAALLNALQAATELYRLITAERVLLEQTLQGSIKALTDLLAIVQPASFGRATRIKRIVESLALELKLADRWQVEIAALLSQVGFIVVPPETAERIHAGVGLTRAEQELVGRLPRLAEGLISSIPRLESVCAILKHQGDDYTPEDSSRSAIPIGARVLRVAQDFDTLESHGMTGAGAFEALERRPDVYDPAVLGALGRVVGFGRPTEYTERMRLSDVQVGMIFATDVVAPNGLLLVARGQEVSANLRERIRNSWYGFAMDLRVRMIIVAAAGEPSAEPLRAS
jgi:response regulator RpfG family c-di-GMP phosphodiesterase